MLGVGTKTLGARRDNSLKTFSIESKSGKEGRKNQSKSIKFVTSCDGHVDGVKSRYTKRNQFFCQNQLRLFGQEVYGHVQLHMIITFDYHGCILCPRPFLKE